MASDVGIRNIRGIDKSSRMLLVSYISRVESALSIKPKKSAPQSPIKVLAGGIFLGKNPSVAKRSKIEHQNTPYEPKISETVAKLSAWVQVIPPARPSSPSQRFVALMMKIIHKRLPMPKSFSVGVSVFIKDRKIYTETAKNSPQSFAKGEIFIASSSKIGRAHV